ncbi:phosphoserine phosphatase SerB [Roseovarius sp. E0-M6]|uniref:phosphoserine phosphatase SerB n=1 Tax=Roseovarius sp. E0-M6 TaxID=3127118 RepID=UPI00300FD34B
MYVVSLIARPGGLQPALVENLRNAWGGAEADWLSPDEAAEFTMERMPDNRWDVWQSLQDERVDMVVQGAENRAKSMLLADMDSTMIEQECIDELAEEAGVGAHVRKITARAMNGELDFEGALIERVALMKGLDSAVIQRVLETRITHMPGASVLLATMRAKGAYTVLVSGGFTEFTGVVATALGFDENRANTLIIEENILSGEVQMPILGRQAKVTALEEVTKLRGLSEQDVIAVGDGANDLGMLRRAGTGVALHAKPSVAAECEVRINHGDLTALLYLQGYARSDFVVPTPKG